MQNMLPYLILINAASLLLMLQDKKNAMRKGPRVPEIILLGSAMLGGSIGAVLGMFFFRHKTRKPLFSIGLPLILLVHMGIFFIIGN